MGAIRRAFLVVPALVLALAVAVGVAAANTFTSGPLVQDSAASPFAGRAADATATQSGTVVVGSEVEPWVDVNPTNSMNLVGIWQQDRWSNGGARGLVAGASTNGGSSWTSVPIPGVKLCAGGACQRATDPWVSFGQNGRVHQLALAFNDSNFDHGLFASFSPNGGLTWSTPRVVIRDLAPTVFNDKQSIAGDQVEPERLRGLGSARLPEGAGEHPTRRSTPPPSAGRRRFQPQHKCAAAPGNSRGRSTIQARTTRRSATRSWCCRTGRWSTSFHGVQQ